MGEPQGGARIQLPSDVQPAASRPALTPRSDATMGKCQAGFLEGSVPPPPLPKLRSHDCQQKQEAGAARDYKPGEEAAHAPSLKPLSPL